MEGARKNETFREWLEEALSESGLSRKGLARRIAERHPHGVTESTTESARRTLRRILSGDLNPTQPTRDSIQEALDRKGAPTVEEEIASEAVARERKVDAALAEIRMYALGGFRS